MEKSDLQQALESSDNPIVQVRDPDGHILFEATVTGLAAMAVGVMCASERRPEPLGPLPVIVAGVAVRPVFSTCRYELKLPGEDAWRRCKTSDIDACLRSHNYEEQPDPWATIHRGATLKSGTGIEYRMVRP